MLIIWLKSVDFEFSFVVLLVTTLVGSGVRVGLDWVLAENKEKPQAKASVNKNLVITKVGNCKNYSLRDT